VLDAPVVLGGNCAAGGRTYRRERQESEGRLRGAWNQRCAAPLVFRGLASGHMLPGGTLWPVQASARHGGPSHPAHKLAYICPGEGARKHPATHGITRTARPQVFRGLAGGGMGESSMPIAHVPRKARAGWALLLIGNLCDILAVGIACVVCVFPGTFAENRTSSA
jgi:hypothetical protein